MPKLKFSLPGDERYNTLMSIVALLQRENEMHIDELAAHFELSRDSMRGMLATLNTTSFMPRNTEEQLPFYIDLDRIDEEDGIVCLELDNGPQGVPTITSTQSVALLSGLRYLKSLPDFEDSDEVDELIDLLSAYQPIVSGIEIEPTKFDSDLSILKKAILTDKRIECLYVNSKGEQSHRSIDPLLLLSSEDHWYLRGYCLKHQAVRTFRLDHMVDAEMVDISRSEAALGAAKSLDETAPIYSPSSNDVEVELELAPEAYQLAGLVGAVREPAKVGEENIRVTIRLGYLPDLGPLVCRYGTHAKVIGPESAREVVRKFALQALRDDASWGDLG
jgi:predicted DNA-binding transcriptional regulator YafY